MIEVAVQRAYGKPSEEAPRHLKVSGRVNHNHALSICEIAERVGDLPEFRNARSARGDVDDAEGGAVGRPGAAGGSVAALGGAVGGRRAALAGGDGGWVAPLPGVAAGAATRWGRQPQGRSDTPRAYARRAEAAVLSSFHLTVPSRLHGATAICRRPNSLRGPKVVKMCGDAARAPQKARRVSVLRRINGGGRGRFRHGHFDLGEVPRTCASHRSFAEPPPPGCSTGAGGNGRLCRRRTEILS